MMTNIDSQFKDEYELYGDMYDKQVEYLNN